MAQPLNLCPILHTNTRFLLGLYAKALDIQLAVKGSAVELLAEHSFKI